MAYPQPLRGCTSFGHRGPTPRTVCGVVEVDVFAKHFHVKAVCPEPSVARIHTTTT